VLRSAFNIALASTLDSIVKPVESSQSASTQSAAASAALTSTTSISTQAGLDDNQKFTQICTTVPTAITDKTSTLYTSINTACTTIPVQQASATPAQKLAALVSAITTACTTASQTSTASTTPSQAQTASTQAFKDITDVAKELLEKQKFDPTITIDQGTLIKIYVNKDYKFPKAAIKNVMK
jgi:type IV secretion system protein VirB10